MNIPIRNIYYLLSYAWNNLSEGEQISVRESDYQNTIELFARVLMNGCKQLFNHGLESNYNEIIEEYEGVKGKILFRDSLKALSFRNGKAYCEFNVYSSNTKLNQIIKATCKRIGNINGLDNTIKESVWKYYWKFRNVEDIALTINDFKSIKIHRNNKKYDILIKVSRLIFDHTSIDKEQGTYQFKDFIGNEKAMASLFESFIRNFYVKEQNRFRVKREDILWDARHIGGTGQNYLPKMQTDISLESQDRKIIIETKYYTSALSSRFENEKINSSNLYQIYSYLRNLESKEDHPQNPHCEGILLYPTVDYSLNEHYIIGTHHITIRTIDLSQDWKMIHKELLNIIQLD